MKRKLSPAWLLISTLLLSSLLLLSACAEGIPQRNPELPPGFVEYLLPDVDGSIGAYVYVRQSQPFVIPGSFFTDEGAQTQAVVPVAPDQLEIDLLAVMMGLEVVDSFGKLFSFTQESHAQWATLALEQQPLDERPWFLRSETQLAVSLGEGEWATAFQEAVANNAKVNLQDAYPDAWRLLHMLPEDVQGEPIAAGFIEIDQVLLDALAQSGNVDLDDLGPAVNVIRVSNVSFAVYSDGPVQLPEHVSTEFFQQADLSAVFIARSGYPSFILSFFFGNFADRIGLEQVDLGDGETVLHAQLSELHLMVKNLGSTIIFTMAPDQARAQGLMVSTLP